MKVKDHDFSTDHDITSKNFHFKSSINDYSLTKKYFFFILNYFLSLPFIIFSLLLEGL